MPSLNDLLHAVWDTDPTVIAYTGTQARNVTALEPGVYYLNATTALHFLQGDETVEATVASNYLPAGAVVAIEVRGETDAFVSVIRHADDGSAYLNKPSPKLGA